VRQNARLRASTEEKCEKFDETFGSCGTKKAGFEKIHIPPYFLPNSLPASLVQAKKKKKKKKMPPHHKKSKNTIQINEHDTSVLTQPESSTGKLLFSKFFFFCQTKRFSRERLKPFPFPFPPFCVSFTYLFIL
jgi:hypothetical protein